VDKKGQVVYVPKGASKSRLERDKKIHVFQVLDQPQALNHGLQPALAAALLLRALAVIDWSEHVWILNDADGFRVHYEDFTNDLEEFVRANAKAILKAFKKRKTGASKKDHYDGKAGTTWYKWKYWDQSGWPASKRNLDDRWEDITHAQYEIDFVVSLRELGRDYFSKSSHFGIQKKHVQRLVVTFLNRINANRTAIGGARFACDINGGMSDKSCRASRVENLRHHAAKGWLRAAVEIKKECDALALVDAVLPLYVVGHPDYLGDETDCLRSNTHSVALLEAKYFFYNLQTALADCTVVL